jgi:hypothetical protein
LHELQNEIIPIIVILANSLHGEALAWWTASQQVQFSRLEAGFREKISTEHLVYAAAKRAMLEVAWIVSLRLDAQLVVIEREENLKTSSREPKTKAACPRKPVYAAEPHLPFLAIFRPAMTLE